MQEARQDPGAILKDNDFVDLNRTINVGPARRSMVGGWNLREIISDEICYRKVLNQMQTDVALLRELRIMDYSLLLGVHYRDRPRPRSRQRITEGERERDFKKDKSTSRETSTHDLDPPQRFSGATGGKYGKGAW